MHMYLYMCVNGCLVYASVSTLICTPIYQRLYFPS